MIRSFIVWCLIVPLLCVFTAGILAAIVIALALFLSGFAALRVLQWGEEPWNRRSGL